MPAWLDETDGCSVVCPDDVGVLVLNPDSSGKYAGTYTGYYGYGWNGYGFVNSLTHIAQIGYPACLDNGLLMERNDSQGYVGSSFSNTIIGSLTRNGSSGGPWITNFGVRADSHRNDCRQRGLGKHRHRRHELGLH